MAKHLASVITLTLAITLNFSTSAFSQESFYKDKVIRIVVATAAGGGYDLYTRTMARHFRNIFRESRRLLLRTCLEQAT